MKVLIFSLSLFMSLSHAGVVELPRGGKLPLDTKIWGTESLKGVGGDGVFLSHKMKKDLRGLILDGNIKDKGACRDSGKKTWETCVKIVPMGKEVSIQLYSQRMIGPSVFQNYVITFNVPEAKKQDMEKEVLALKKYIEGHHE